MYRSLDQTNNGVLVTGATGFVGSYLVKLLLERGNRVYALARDQKGLAPQERIFRILNFWDRRVLKNKRKNLTIIKGDLTQENLSLSRRNLNILKHNITEVFHCGAATRFEENIKILKNVNISGCQNLFSLCLEWKKGGRCNKVNHLSTAYICGNFTGNFKETHLDVGQKFYTYYEESKFLAEKIVEEYRKSGLAIDIFRPPAIVGETKSGKALTFNQSLYQFLHVLSLGIFDLYPVDIKQKFNMVCVDELCCAIILINQGTKNKNCNYHTFPSNSLSLRKIIKFYAHFLKLNDPTFISLEKFYKSNFSTAQRKLIEHNLLFLSRKVNFDSRFTNSYLKEKGFKFSAFSKNLLISLVQYPLKTGFIKIKR